jgi:hypothetical protein
VEDKEKSRAQSAEATAGHSCSARPAVDQVDITTGHLAICAIRRDGRKRLVPRINDANRATVQGIAAFARYDPALQHNDTQTMLCHTKPDTAQINYVLPVEDSVRSAVDKLAATLLG